MVHSKREECVKRKGELRLGGARKKEKKKNGKEEKRRNAERRIDGRRRKRETSSEKARKCEARKVTHGCGVQRESVREREGKKEKEGRDETTQRTRKTPLSARERQRGKNNREWLRETRAERGKRVYVTERERKGKEKGGGRPETKGGEEEKTTGRVRDKGLIR